VTLGARDVPVAALVGRALVLDADRPPELALPLRQLVEVLEGGALGEPGELNVADALVGQELVDKLVDRDDGIGAVCARPLSHRYAKVYRWARTHGSMPQLAVILEERFERLKDVDRAKGEANVEDGQRTQVSVRLRSATSRASQDRPAAHLNSSARRYSRMISFCGWI
jgi:hypothetical protein